MTNNTFSLSMLQHVIDYVEEHLLEELTPASIAAHFYVSVSTLTSLFRMGCGMTIMEYIRNRRLTLAAGELSASGIPIIELAYKYGYETPEAFTKAFSRFFSMPPSFVRRGFPIIRCFEPMKLEVHIQGGFRNEELTKSNCMGQEMPVPMGYNTFIESKGGVHMNVFNMEYRIDTDIMQYEKEWKVLVSLAKKLQESEISYKVDGKTMIFAHGLEFPLDKLCFTFKWKDEEKVKSFWERDVVTKQTEEGFKFFDVTYMGMKIRCMFYGNCVGDDSDAFLYRNTDVVRIDSLLVPVQSLEFYYANAVKDSEYYKLVEEWLRKHERI